MYNRLKINNQFSLCLKIRKRTKVCPSNRSMQTLSKTQIAPLYRRSMLSQEIGRRYLGRFKGGNFANETTKPDGSPLDQHEAVHGVIYDTKLQRVVALATSCKKDAFRVSSVKVDGTYTERVTAKSNKAFMDDYGYQNPKIKSPVQTIVDDYGNTVPHTISGGQYFRWFATHRIPGKGTFIEDPRFTKYLDFHENPLLAEIAKLPDYEKKPAVERIKNPNITTKKTIDDQIT